MRTCDIDGCSNAHRAKGLCVTHYNAINRKPNPTSEYTCPMCGNSFVKETARANRYKNVYCSPDCRDAHRAREHTVRRKAIVRYVRPATRPQAQTAMRKLPTRVFKAGTCRVCASPFLCLFGSRSCSAECQAIADRAINSEVKHRRRARLKDAYRAPVFRIQIYNRDAWCCQLCGDPISRDEPHPHPLSVTIDHIIPLARGGTHEPNNVQTAHFLCNSLKGDRVA